MSPQVFYWVLYMGLLIGCDNFFFWNKRLWDTPFDWKYLVQYIVLCFLCCMTAHHLAHY